MKLTVRQLKHIIAESFKEFTAVPSEKSVDPTMAGTEREEDVQRKESNKVEDRVYYKDGSWTKHLKNIGDKFWYDNQNRMHRTNGPAYTGKKNDVYFIKNKIHREDGPAIIDHRTGEEIWYKNGHEVPTPDGEEK